jgi:hypothetical protein
MSYAAHIQSATRFVMIVALDGVGPGVPDAIRRIESPLEDFVSTAESRCQPGFA